VLHPTQGTSRNSTGVRATPSNILKQASCRLYKNSGSNEMRLMGDYDQI